MKVEVFPIQVTYPNGALCLLLSVESQGHKLQIMLDCGINQSLEINNLKHYMNKIQKTKLVLLSQASLECAGGIPIISEFKIPTFATSPIIDFGLRNFVDQLVTIQQAFVKQEYDSEAERDNWKSIIESAEDSYNKIKRLNFGQQENFSFENGRFNVRVCPIRSGKVLGNCAWKISINQLNIIYMSDFNMQKELHVDSLNIEKLIHRNQLHSLNLHKEQVDLLILDTYPTTKQPQDSNQELLIKNTIDESINYYYTQNRLKGQLIFVFYPTERILEGVISLDQIFRDNPQIQGLKCEVLSTYDDLVEKAGGFTDFLGSQFVNWKHQEGIYQTPFDPEYIKQLFSSQKVKSANIILTNFNILFSGPLYQESFLADPNNIIVLFGQPPQLLNDNLLKLKSSQFKGEINVQIKDQTSINLNNIKKQLLKNTNSEQKNIQSKQAPSQTFIYGTATTATEQSDQQSLDQTKSHEKISEEEDELSSIQDFQSISLKSQLDVQQTIIDEPIFAKPTYKSHPQLYTTDNNQKDTINLIQAAQQSVMNALRPMPNLLMKEDYGVEVPQFLQQLAQKNKQYLIQQTLEIEEELEKQLQPKQKLNESNFALPQPQNRSSIQYVNAKLIYKTMTQSQNYFQVLLENLNPTQILLLSQTIKPKQSQIPIQMAKLAQNQEIMRQMDGQLLSFVEMSEVERGTILQVKGSMHVKYLKNNQKMNILLKLQSSRSAQLEQEKKNQKCGQLIQLYEYLKNKKNLIVEIGFSQLQINNGQIIVTRTKDGFEIEGYYCPMYVEIRNLIKQLNM